MKNKLILFFILLLLPMFVYAETCNNNDVVIKDLELVNITGLAVELEEAELVDSKIIADVKMYEVGDSIEYKFTVENESENEYTIDTRNLVNIDPYVNYVIDSEDHSNKIKKSSSKEFTITATYANEVLHEDFKAGKYDGSIDMILDIVDPALINPMTGNFFYYILIILLLVCIIFGIKYKKNSITSLGIIGLLLIPYTTYAICTFNVELDIDVKIGYVKPNPCTYNGDLVQGAKYVNGQYTYSYKQKYGKWNSSLRTYEFENIDSDGWGVTLTDPESTEPVTSTLCTSINDKPIVTMAYMFIESNTTSIDTSSFDTSNVTDMQYMFSWDENITSLDVSNFDTSQVTNMSSMFFSCENLTELDVSNFDTSNVTSFYCLFAYSGITSIDLSNWNISKANNFYNFFSSCNDLESVNLDNWVLEIVPNGFFSGAYNIKTMSMKNWVLPSNSNGYLFGNMALYESSSVEEIDVTGWDVSRYSSFYRLFDDLRKLKRIIGLETWDTSNVTNMSGMFYNCYALVDFDISNLDISNVTDVSSMFYYCQSIEEINLDNWVLPNSYSGFLDNANSLKKISAKNWIIRQNDTWLFSKIGVSSSVETIDVTGWDLSNTTSLNGIFYNSQGLKNIIGLDTWDTSNITDISSMFSWCCALENVDITNFDTSNVTTISYLLYHSESITTLDLSTLDLDNVSNTNYMFENADSLTTVYVKNSADQEKINSSSNKPSSVNVVIKSV